MDITTVMTLGFGAIGGILVYLVSKIDKLDDRVNGLKDSFSDFRVDFSLLKVNVEGLQKQVATLQGQFRRGELYGNVRLARQHSPLTLTSEGKEICELIDADALFAAHKAELYAQLDESKLKNAYDVQEETFYVVAQKFLDLLTEGELTELKNVAYAKGDMIQDYLVLFQIMLRDDVLKSKGIEITEQNLSKN